jgi:anti-sigma factor RsiW
MMMSVPDEMLMAYADGELSPAESQALENLLHQDSALRARLEPFVTTRTRLAAVFEARLHEPIPDRLIAAIARARPASPPVAKEISATEMIRHWLDAATAALFPNGLSQAALASVAALLCVGAAAGYLAGRASSPETTTALVATSGSAIDLVATGNLAAALETSPSGTAVNAEGTGASIVPVLSFRTQGGICREYRIAHTAASSAGPAGPDFAGVACRTADGRWRLALHTETPRQVPASGSTGGYQTATANNVPAVDALVDTLITGDALGAADEAALMKRGWQAPPAPAHP